MQNMKDSPDRGYYSEMREFTPGLEASRSEKAGLFAGGLPGDDPETDPLFFEESWTLGAAAAAGRWRQRQKEPENCECQRRAIREFNSVGTLAFVQDRERYAERFSMARPATASGHQDSDWLPPFFAEPFTQTENQAPQGWETFAEENSRPRTTHSMTRQHARHLLGVTAASTREQIKAAYRRMASQWHPDRLKCRTEEARHLATEQMAAINEAYSIIREATGNL
jgi:hypothetical protein